MGGAKVARDIRALANAARHPAQLCRFKGSESYRFRRAVGTRSGCLLELLQSACIPRK